MKKGLTEIVFILDRSGSMSGLEKDTIGGFNSTIEKQKKEAGEAFVSTVLFDSEMEVLHDRVPLASVAPLTDREYYARGAPHSLMLSVGPSITLAMYISTPAKKTVPKRPSLSSRPMATKTQAANIRLIA